MSTAILTSQTYQSPVSRTSQWIISQREDLLWFIGSSLLGFMALASIIAGLPVVTAFLFWNLVIDGPHVFATASRTYFDKQARRRLGWRLWLIVPLVIVGPVATGLGFGTVLMFTIITWAQYHVAKQHFGFVMLYKRKTNERSDVKLDKRFLLSSLMLPWFVYLLATLGLTHMSMVRVLVSFLLASYIGFVFFYLARQIKKAINGEILNTPKLLLLLFVIPLQWVAFVYSIDNPSGLVIAGIATNIGHSLQYQRLTWFHNQNRYLGETNNTIGLAALVNSRFSIYFLAAFFLNLLISVGFPFLVTSTTLLSAAIGINMLHYYLDSLIWRTRSDKELAAALRL